MILGIGTDIVEIKRFEKTASNIKFLNKIFSEKELLIINGKLQSIAGNFAAKEAVVKALGTGFSGIPPKEIEILRNIDGCPYCLLSGNAQKTAEKLNISKILVSISHSKNYAIATAVAEKEKA